MFKRIFLTLSLGAMALAIADFFSNITGLSFRDALIGVTIYLSASSHVRIQSILKGELD